MTTAFADPRIANALYPQSTPALASDGWTNLDKLWPTETPALVETIAESNPTLTTGQAQASARAFKDEAYAAGLTSGEVTTLARVVRNELSRPTDGADLEREAQTTMAAMRRQHGAQWPAKLSQVEQLLKASPELRRFVDRAPAARTKPEVLAVLVEAAHKAHMGGRLARRG